MRIACILVLCAACGGGKGGFSVAASFDRSADVFCSQAHACRAQFPSDAGFMFEDLFEDTEPACIASLQGSSNAAEVQASVDAGRILFDPTDADACTDFFEQQACADFWGTLFDNTPPRPAACDTAFVGTVPPGGTCTIDLDCIEFGCIVNNGIGTCGG